MKPGYSRRHARARFQKGAAAVEFALVAALFLIVLLLGIIEIGRAFFLINATAEATRRGARIAVVCDVSAAQRDLIRARMKEYALQVLPADHIAIDYTPANCAPGTCRSVTVSILPGATFPTFIPFVPLTWELPAFATTLPTESLDSAAGANPVCQ
jgi:Flp pilus assembly protein TadG